MILDASAVIAFILNEAGASRVGFEIDAGASISVVNLAEVVTASINLGSSEEKIRHDVGELHLNVIPFDEELAYQAGLLVSVTRRRGLSLGDRACLATALHRKLPVLTGDHAWQDLPLDIEIEFFR